MTFEGRDDTGFLVDTPMESSTGIESKPKAPDTLVVALDVPTYDEAAAIVRELGDEVSFYKIGLELVMDGGLELARRLLDDGYDVFLDMKFLDIGTTVEKAVRNVSKIGVRFLTVHALDRKTLHAAQEGKTGSNLQLLGVTVLTSLTKEDLEEQGISESPGRLALRRAKMAFEAGLDGVIASGFDARAIREATSKGFVIKTPGIRPHGSATNDQARAMTPREAILAGADYLVVGRPILQASDRRMAARKIQNEIRAAKALLGG